MDVNQGPDSKLDQSINTSTWFSKDRPAQKIIEEDPVLAHITKYLLHGDSMPKDIQEDLISLKTSLDLEKPFEEQPEVLRKICSVLRYLGHKSTAGFYEKKYFSESEADKVATEMNALLTSRKVPIHGSNVGFYGSEVAITPHELIYTKTSRHMAFDLVENRLFKLDDIGSLVRGKAIRKKIGFPEIAERVKKLELSQYFKFDGESFHENLDHYESAAMLDDLSRDHTQTEEKKLAGLSIATQTLQKAQEISGGGIGEALMNDFVLKVENGEIKSARLMLPDVAYEKDVPVLHQKAMDLIDLCFSSASSVFQCNQDQPEKYLKNSLQTILSAYTGGDAENVKLIMSALVLQRPTFNFHSKRRYGFDQTPPPHQDKFEFVRQYIVQELKAL